MNFFKLLILTFVMVSLNACMDKTEETLELETDIKVYRVRSKYLGILVIYM